MLFVLFGKQKTKFCKIRNMVSQERLGPGDKLGSMTSFFNHKSSCARKLSLRAGRIGLIFWLTGRALNTSFFWHLDFLARFYCHSISILPRFFLWPQDLSPLFFKTFMFCLDLFSKSKEPWPINWLGQITVSCSDKLVYIITTYLYVEFYDDIQQVEHCPAVLHQEVAHW